MNALKLTGKGCETLEDKEIVGLLLARDEQAIDHTMEKYGGFFRSLARNILNDDLDAEECENDVYMLLWRSIPPNEPSDLSAYIAKLTRNAALNKLQYRHASKREGITVSLNELSEVLADESTDSSSEEIAKAISAFLRRSGENERRIFVKHYFALETLEKIAQDEDCGIGKLKSILFRMRKKLRIYLEKEGIAL